MKTQVTTKSALFWLMTIAVPPSIAAQSIVVPEGTTVLAEFQYDVRSKKREIATGDLIRTRVAQDVVIDGAVVFEAGAELMLRVEYMKKAKMFGRKGHLHLEPVSVLAVDGESTPLDGLYIRHGTGRKAVTATLAIAVAWPFAFLKGKQAKVPQGTIVETRTRGTAEITPRLRLAAH